MQTFIASYDLKNNAQILDNRRLFKQLLEGYTILDIIVNEKTGAWSRHPATLAWKNNPIGLFWYIRAIWFELQNRKIALNSKLFKNCENIITKYCDDIGWIDYVVNSGKKENLLPKWWGDKDIIRTHRSRLKLKGLIDVQCKAIKKFLKLRSINDWLWEQFRKEKNELRYVHAVALDNFIQKMGIKNTVEKNHYDIPEWSKVPFNLEYKWPNK